MKLLQTLYVLLVIAIIGGCAANVSNDPVPQQPAFEDEDDIAELSRVDVTGSRLSPRNREGQRIGRILNEVEGNEPFPTGHQANEKAYWSKQRFYQVFRDYGVNPTVLTEAKSESTFALDVDDGSYKLALNMLNNQVLPNVAGIRVEEFINAQKYHYKASDELFSLSAEAMPSPFRKGYHVLHLGIQAKQIANQERLPVNLVLVADVSGSMGHDDKLTLLKKAFTTLVTQLTSSDQVALVAYENTATLVLPPINASKKRYIIDAINRLQVGGSTNAEAGIALGYDVAASMFQAGFANHVILTSDGMANVAAVSPEAILNTIEQQKERGIFLTTVGVGLDMFNDAMLEQLANKGNGHYLYFADDQDIQLAFVDRLESQLQTVAKNVKSQVVFNKNSVSHYRLLGYENRSLNKEDFLDANKDGGEVGAGQRVTAIYEVRLTNDAVSEDLASFSIAYQKPAGRHIHTITKKIPQSIVRHSVDSASADLRLSAGAAAFAEKLRLSYWSGQFDYDDILEVLDSLPQSYLQDEQVQRLNAAVFRASQLDRRKNPHASVIERFSLDHVPLLQ